MPQLQCIPQRVRQMHVVVHQVVYCAGGADLLNLIRLLGKAILSKRIDGALDHTSIHVFDIALWML